MKTLVRRIKISAITVIVVMLIAAIGSFMLVRPLLPSDSYSVTATLDGSPIDAKLYKLFPFGSYYVHFTGDPAARYNWFGVAFGRESVFIPIGLRTSPWGHDYIHFDQDKGVVVTSGKMEDNWKIEFTDSGVIFQNDSTRIELAN
ncbi:hypothetical protein [Luteolibacter sp. AS25]|uniref:hypothetical protein n=1 Tax=Luteolibacter sp. AS25 TaxID=3135776 RepID=UPI00398B54C7